MQSCFKIACLSIIFFKCVQTKEEAEKGQNDMYYIKNWEEYGIPPSIEASKLMLILNKIALYKQMKYCPFRDAKECSQSHYHDVVSKIIADVVGNSTEKEKDMDYEDGNEEDEMDDFDSSKNKGRSTGDPVPTRTVSIVTRAINNNNQRDDEDNNTYVTVIKTPSSKTILKIKRIQRKRTDLAPIIVILKNELNNTKKEPKSKHKKNKKGKSNRKYKHKKLLAKYKNFHVRPKYKKIKKIPNMGPFKPIAVNG